MSDVASPRHEALRGVEGEGAVVLMMLHVGWGVEIVSSITQMMTDICSAAAAA